MQGFEKTEFTDMDDCIDKVDRSSKKVSAVLITVIFLIQLHFCCVVYTHWKNSHLTKAKGGCEPNIDEGDIQMHSESAPQVVASVQHAIDDEQLDRTALSV